MICFSTEIALFFILSEGDESDRIRGKRGTAGVAERSKPNLGRPVSIEEGIGQNLGGMNTFAVGINPNLGNVYFECPHVFGSDAGVNSCHRYGLGRSVSPNYGNPYIRGLGGPSMVVDPYSINRGDVEIGKSIVKRILTRRENYVTWNMAMKISISKRSQLGFVSGEYPKSDDPCYGVSLAKVQ